VHDVFDLSNDQGPALNHLQIESLRLGECSVGAFLTEFSHHAGLQLSSATMPKQGRIVRQWAIKSQDETGLLIAVDDFDKMNLFDVWFFDDSSRSHWLAISSGLVDFARKHYSSCIRVTEIPLATDKGGA
jgi:hypothetical protein